MSATGNVPRKRVTTFHLPVVIIDALDSLVASQEVDAIMRPHSRNSLVTQILADAVGVQLNLADVDDDGGIVSSRGRK